MVRAQLDAETLRAAWVGSAYAHFSGHGRFSPGKPSSSGLLLGAGRVATVADILNFDLKGVRLVTLSACQTSVSDAAIASDDALAVGHALLCAGASAVAATLCKVDEVVSLLFYCRFYELLGSLRPGMAPSTRADVAPDRYALRARSLHSVKT